MSFFTKTEARQAANNVTASTESFSLKLESLTKMQESSSSFDIFLSHSILDAQLVLGIQKLLKDRGFTVYIDWVEDRQLSRNHITPETAKVLKKRMQQSTVLLYLATESASNSKWMPWELGVFDGMKPNKVGILPVQDTPYESFNGQEYLGLYPAIEKEQINRFVNSYI